jgi:hypothetical protein
MNAPACERGNHSTNDRRNQINPEIMDMTCHDGWGQ